MRRILYVVSTLGKSAPTVQLLNIIKNLEGRDFSCLLITLSPEPKESMREEFLAIPHLRLESLFLSRLAGLFFSFSALKKIIAHWNPDMIHSQGIRADCLVTLVRGKLPHIMTVHNFPQLDYCLTYGFLLGKAMTHLHVSAWKRGGFCVGVSHAVSENLQRLFSLENARTIHNGVSERFIPKKHEEKLALRQMLGLPLDSQIWVVLGSLTKGKRSDFLVDLWSRLSKKCDMSTTTLLFLGEGNLLRECRERAHGVVGVRFLGHIQDPLPYLQASDFYLSASAAEGLPNALLESMACGRPAVVSNIPPHREIAMHPCLPEGSVTLFDLSCHQKAEEILPAMMEHWPSEELSLQISHFIHQEFSAKRMAEAYASLYHELTASRSEMIA